MLHDILKSFHHKLFIKIYYCDNNWTEQLYESASDTSMKLYIQTFGVLLRTIVSFNL